MNICFATACYRLPDTPIGGLPIHYEALATGLVEKGHSVSVLYCDRFGRTNATHTEGGVSFTSIRFGIPPIFRKRLIGGMIKCLGISENIRFRSDSKLIAQTIDDLHMQRRFDLIESPNNGATLVSYLDRRKRPPSCLRIATTDKEHTLSNIHQVTPYHKKSFDAEGATFRKCPNLVTHTLCHRNLICQEYDLSPKKFTIIPLAVKIPEATEITHSQNSEKIKVLFVGRFELRKGIDVMLEAIPKVLKACPEVEFRLVGPDPDLRFQKAFRKEHSAKILEKVEFPGEKVGTALEREYKDCNVFAAPSRYESFGLIYAEAMSYEKPSVGTRAGGIPEVVVHGETGLLCEPGDAGDLSRNIIKLCRSPELCRSMGEAGRKRVIQKFSLPQLIQDTEEYYQHLIGAEKT